MPYRRNRPVRSVRHVEEVLLSDGRRLARDTANQPSASNVGGEADRAFSIIGSVRNSRLRLEWTDQFCRALHPKNAARAFRESASDSNQIANPP